MKHSKEVLSAEYQRVCQQLGDCHLKLKQLQASIDKLEAEATNLNESFRLLAKVEEATTLSHQPREKESELNDL